MMHRSRNRNRSGTAGLAELSYAVEAKANLAHGQSIFYVLLLLTFCVLISTSTTLFRKFNCKICFIFNHFSFMHQRITTARVLLSRILQVQLLSRG